MENVSQNIKILSGN